MRIGYIAYVSLLFGALALAQGTGTPSGGNGS